ncbi:DsrE family protein [Candidatus Bathyarchaeota archaeon]|nr:DsrE family protein [Candidatus Bathyarchaeota archaeon]
METLTIILNDAPYGNEKVWNALRLAKALTSATVKMKVNIFLLGDAVSSAKKGQKTPEGYYNLQQMLKELIEQGVEVIACGTCVAARGLSKEELLKDVRIGTMMQLAQWIKESQKILSF